jgi:hypothetical protein
MSDLTVLLLESHRHFWAGNAFPTLLSFASLPTTATIHVESSSEFLGFIEMIDLIIEIAHTTQPRIA